MEAKSFEQTRGFVMRKRTTQLSVSLAVLAFSSMSSSVFSGEPLRDSFTVIITTHLDMIARSNESYFLDRPIYRRSNNGIVGDGGGATEQIGGVGSDYQGACGGEGSGDHGDITGAIRVTQHHDWIVQQINDGREHVVNILTSKIPNGTGQQINDGGEVEGDDRRVLSPGSDPILRKRPGRGNGDGKLNDAEKPAKKSSGSSAGRCTSPGVCSGELGHIYGCGYIGPQYPAKGQAPAVDHNSSRSNNGIVGGGGGTDMDVLGRRWRGDANRDGVVTGTDLIVVQQNFGLSVALDGLLDGDANNDGQVTGMDLIEVQQTFGQVTGNAIVGSGLSNLFGVIVGDNHFIGPLGGDGVFSVHNNTFGQVESTDAAVVAAVPEPATIALISAGLLFMRKTRRTR